MGFLDRVWEDERKGINKYLFAMLLAVLKEIGQVTARELAKGLEEFLKESKTPDGWTREEYLTYAIGRLHLLKDEEIGPFFVDNLLDMAIDRLIDTLNGKLEAPDADPPVEPPPPSPLYDVLFPSTPDPLNYVEGDVLYERATGDPTGAVTKQYRVLKGVVKYPGETMIGYRDDAGTWTLY